MEDCILKSQACRDSVSDTSYTSPVRQHGPQQDLT